MIYLEYLGIAANLIFQLQLYLFGSGDGIVMGAVKSFFLSDILYSTAMNDG